MSHDLLERDDELARIEALLAQARAGRGGAALVEGPAGIGKSGLLEAARARAGRCRVLRARGGELERDFPWGVVRQLFEAPVAFAPAQERAELLAGAAVHAIEPLGLAMPAAAGDDRAADAGFAAIHGLYWLTVALAEREPLLLLVDDAHWADAASLRFLGYLARRVEELPVLVLASRRPHADAMAFDVAAEAAPIAPAPLSEAAVAAIVRSAWPDGAHDVFCAACHRASGGNPFLVHQLVSHLRERVVEPTAEGARTALEAGPRSVARYLGTLPAPARALARAVSVLGAEVQLRHAAALADLDAPEAGRVADALAASDVLRPERPLEFVHPVVRAAVGDAMPAGERSAAHDRAARLLADEGAAAGRVAVHLLAVDPGGDPWRVEILQRAATEALERGAPDAAVRFLRRAVAEPASRPAARPSSTRSVAPSC